jgi:transcriptional regulator with XRE-family HTH domain
VPNSKQLGVAIRAERKKKKLTIEALAEAAEMDTSYLSGIERRGRNLTWLKLTAIVKALEVDTSALVRRAEKIARAEGS